MCKILGMIEGHAVFNNLEVSPSTRQDDDGDRSLMSVAIYRASISWNSKIGGWANSGVNDSPLPSNSRWRSIPMLLKKLLKA